MKELDQLQVAKLAYLEGYKGVFVGETGDEAAPGDWVLDITVINDFASDVEGLYYEEDDEEEDKYYIDYLVNEIGDDSFLASDKTVDELLKGEY